MNTVVLIGLGRVALLLLALVNVRVYTEMLSATQVGRLSLLVATFTVISVLVDRSLGAYWYRMLVQWSAVGELRGELRRLALRVALLAIACAAGASLISARTSLVAQVTPGVVGVLTFLAIAINGGFTAISGALNILGHRAAFVSATLAASALALGVATSLTRAEPLAESWLFGTYLAQAVVLVPAVILVVRASSGVENTSNSARPRTTPGSWASFTLPSLVSAAFYAAQLMGYRFVLNYVAGTTTLAYFTVAFGLGVAAMNAFEYFITQLVQPRFLHRIALADSHGMTIAWNAYASAVVPAVLLMAAFAGAAGPFVMRLGAASTFASAGSLVVWGVAADALRIVAQTLGMVHQATLRTKRFIAPSAIGVFVSLGLGGVLAQRYPLFGMGVGMVVGAALWATLSGITARRELPVSFPWARTARAAVAALPLVVGLTIAARRDLAATAGQSFAVLLVGGTVMCALQAVFALEWLRDIRVTPAAASGLTLEVGA